MVIVLELSTRPIRVAINSFGWGEKASLNFRDDQSLPETFEQINSF